MGRSRTPGHLPPIAGPPDAATCRACPAEAMPYWRLCERCWRTLFGTSPEELPLQAEVQQLTLFDERAA